MKQKRMLAAAVTAADLVLGAVCMTLYLKEDRTAPEFRFQADESVYSYAEGEGKLLENITAYDDRDGDVTERIVIEKITENRENATIVVYYAVSDSAGNVAKISRVFPAEFGEQESSGQENMEVYSGSPEKEALSVERLSGRESGRKQETDESGGEDAPAAEETDAAQKDGGDIRADGREEGSAGAGTEEDRNADSAEEEEENHAGMDPAEAAGPEETGDGEGTAGAENSGTGSGEEAGRNPGDHGTAGPGSGEARGREAERADGASEGNLPPVIVLKTAEVTIDAGTSPPWSEIIESLLDDRDDYETLYRGLKAGGFNRNEPGDYPASLYTADSEGSRSEAVSVMVHVK